MLRAGGHFVFSTGHPFGDWLLNPGGNYFETELVEYVWSGFGGRVVMPSHRRPLAALLNPLLDAGFALERIVEPTPTEEFREKDPENYAQLCRQPGFICVRASKNPPS